jgi:hypothetical protein
MGTDAAGQVGDTRHLENRAIKGKKGGRSLPLHPQMGARPHGAAPGTAREGGALAPAHLLLRMQPGPQHRHGATVVSQLYSVLGFAGCFSPSERHTFITRAVRNAAAARSLYATYNNSLGMPTLA